MRDYSTQAATVGFISRLPYHRGRRLGLPSPNEPRQSPPLSPRDRVAPGRNIIGRLAQRSSLLPWIKRNGGAYSHIGSQ